MKTTVPLFALILSLVVVRMVLGQTAMTSPAPSTLPSGLDPAITAHVVERAIVSEGNLYGIQRIMFKAQRGEPITIATLGGSITQGSRATQMKNRYPNVITAWWQTAFPTSKITLVNAGIGSTGSDFGALRVGSHVLSHHPDLVVVEFAVNDANTRAKAETFEGVIRQILADPGNPAVVVLFMSDHGHNAQEQQSAVAAHYDLPMVSYRDALWPEIDAGRLQLNAITMDNLHPNDRGHVITGQLLDHLFEIALQKMPVSEPAAVAYAMPAPLISDTFQHVYFVEGSDMKPTANTGWTFDPARNVNSWKTEKPGSSIEFDIPGGSMIFLNYYRVHGALGEVETTVDGTPAKTVDAWFDQTWGSYRETTLLANDLPPGKHHVKIVLSKSKNDQSTGFEFRITGLAAAGLN
jgi:lysophospholipase L1-like esterase